jgi:hypothetical protein
LVCLSIVMVLAAAPPAAAQQTATGVLSFLLTNRSISTGDFARDEAAAAATRDAFILFLRTELATLPITTPASGFTYRLNPEIGIDARSTTSFGPFFTERSLSAGPRHLSFSVSYAQTDFDNIDGRSLRDGTLVSIASMLRGESQPFDVETLALHIQSRTTTIAGHWGITDRLDFVAAMPFVSVTLSGQRVDTYRGSSFLQATGVASASGPGDLALRAKYNAIRRGASGLALGVETRLATGDADNLLGSGHTSVAPRVMASLERSSVSLHVDVAYAFGGISRELKYGGAVTVAPARRLTLVGELIGSYLPTAGQLVEVTEPRPGLVGVDTIRLTNTTQGTSRILVVGGFRWNMVSRWLLSFDVLRPLSSAGLNPRWVPMLILDYSIGR